MTARTNDYAEVAHEIYDRTPKAVFAALAVSLASTRDDGEGEIAGRGWDAVVVALIDEWEILHDNGIVPQRPPSRAAAIGIVAHETG